MKIAFFTSRKFRQGSMATVITVLTIALIVVVNMIMTALTNRFTGLTFDMTQGGFLSLSDESVEFLSGLDRQVDIYVLNTEDAFSSGSTYYQQANEVLKNYAKVSGNVNLSYVDMVRDPTFAQAYPQLELRNNTILITSGDNATTLAATELFNYQQDSYSGQTYIASSKAEQAMATAILNVTTDQKINVVFLEGHGETDMSDLRALLTANAYEVSAQSLLTDEEIDPEAEIAVLAAPLRDLADDELRKLDKFLDNNGKLGRTLYYFASIEQEETPNLDAFLRDWGVNMHRGVVYETSSNRTWLGVPYYVQLDYAEQDYAANMITRQLVPFTIYARPMSISFPWSAESEAYANAGVYATVLQQFSPTAEVMAMTEEEAELPLDYDTDGIPALVMGYRVNYDGMERIQSNVIISSSTESMGSTVLSMPSFSNSEYHLELLGKLAGRSESIYIQDKTRSYSVLDNMSDFTALVLSLIFMIVLPLAALIFGIVVWLRRRHR